MASAADKIRAQVAHLKRLQLAAFQEAVQMTVEAMQEPGPSKATVAKAVAAGAGLGKVGKSGRRGVSRTAYGPIGNPGGGGNLPVDTGFLRASLMAGIGDVVFTARSRPDDPAARYTYDPSAVELVIAHAKPGDTITIGYAADYARFVEYGAGGVPGRAFVRRALQRWPEFIGAAVSRANAALDKGGSGGVA